MDPDIRLSLRSLRAFATVVELGSITGAARVLNLAPSAVSAALNQVEAEFGASLLIRTPARGITATAEGRAMADRFRLLLDEYHTVLATGREMAAGLSGTLRIGYYAPVAPAFLPRLLEPMRAGNPDLRFELCAHDNDSVQEALLTGRVDAILFAGQNQRRGITCKHLLDLPPYVLAPKGHPILRGNRPIEMASLDTLPLVQLDRPLARPYLDALFATRGLKANVVARADSTEMVRSLVGAGHGIAILNMRPLSTVSYGGDGLAAAPLTPGLPALELLSGHASGQPRRVVSLFLERLHSWMQSDAAKAVIVEP